VIVAGIFKWVSDVACNISAPAQQHYRNLFQHILVDEFQDTSQAQFELVTSLAPHGAVTVVGDDDQTIFAFNGSNHKNFDLFRKAYPAFSEVRLEHNYRSSGVIVDAARGVIQVCCLSAYLMMIVADRCLLSHSSSCRY